MAGFLRPIGEGSFFKFKNIVMHIQSLVRGIAIGFVLGVLYAPNRGEETRRKISQKATDIKDSVKGTYDAVSNTVTKVKDKADQVLHKDKYNAS